jgi:hypothetical protein
MCAVDRLLELAHARPERTRDLGKSLCAEQQKREQQKQREIHRTVERGHHSPVCHVDDGTTRFVQAWLIGTPIDLACIQHLRAIVELECTARAEHCVRRQGVASR